MEKEDEIMLRKLTAIAEETDNLYNNNKISSFWGCENIIQLQDFVKQLKQKYGEEEYLKWIKDFKWKVE
jgi:predicted 3-demethylubiquinone-9 3-methyltransferase (glyoxalase superfamily)